MPARPVYLQHGIRHGSLSSSSETHVAQHVLWSWIVGFWVSSSAKFLPSVGKTKIPCDSFTSDVIFVDDQAFLMTATTPSGLKRVITNTLETVTSVFRSHGLNINFKQGKTELVVNFQGVISRKKQIPCRDSGATQHVSSPCSCFSARGSCCSSLQTPGQHC